jgi:serine/threonine kinase 16
MGCGFSRHEQWDVNGMIYVPSKKIGEGSYGIVWAVKSSAGEIYALKRMILGDDNRSLALKEIDLLLELSALNHPNIIKLVEYAENPWKQGMYEYLLLFPLYTGSLQQYLTHLRENEQNLSLKEAIAIFVGVCEGVTCFHHHSPPLVHRDIKPGNILLTSSKTPILIDFASAGLANVPVSDTSAALNMQDSIDLVCTQAYMAPELLMVSPDVLLSPASDVWSLGCLLFALTYGRGISPWEKEAMRGGSAKLAALSGVVHYPDALEGYPYPMGLKTLINSLLDMDPQRRGTVDSVILEAKGLIHV